MCAAPFAAATVAACGANWQNVKSVLAASRCTSAAAAVVVRVRSVMDRSPCSRGALLG
jgi:hypothetical protein